MLSSLMPPQASNFAFLTYYSSGKLDISKIQFIKCKY